MICVKVFSYLEFLFILQKQTMQSMVCVAWVDEVSLGSKKYIKPTKIADSVISSARMFINSSEPATR